MQESLKGFKSSAAPDKAPACVPHIRVKTSAPGRLLRICKTDPAQYTARQHVSAVQQEAHMEPGWAKISMLYSASRRSAAEQQCAPLGAPNRDGELLKAATPHLEHCVQAQRLWATLHAPQDLHLLLDLGKDVLHSSALPAQAAADEVRHLQCVLLPH